MNKNPRTIFAIVIVILVIVGIVWFGRGGSEQNPNDINGQLNTNASTTTNVVITETSKVSNKLSEFQNAELGFSVKYPSVWQSESSNSGVTFLAPLDQNQVSTVSKIQSDINVIAGKCTFPPVTTIKERGTLPVGKLTMNMISMSNTVQGRNYFNRMYSLQKDNICYFFSFSSITLSPASKALKGSSLTQAENNNKAIINTADTAFIDMVKSFAFVTGPQGIDETKVLPVKK